MGRTACTELQCLYSRAIPPLPLWAVRSVQSLSACTVELYLHSPNGPYGLYRASVPVQYSYTSTPPMGRTACTELQCLYSRAIPLLPLWAVRTVQSLSACTVQLYLYSPYGRTVCTDSQCLYSTAIPLLPLWAVSPVQSLSYCTVQLYLYSPCGPYGLYRASVPVQFSYTSTPFSACTVQLYLYSPQCLYSTAIPLLPSVPVQFSYTSTPPMGRTDCTEPECPYSTAIPLLPSVPVQYSYTSTPPMGRTACTEPQSLYRGVLYVPFYCYITVSFKSWCRYFWVCHN